VIVDSENGGRALQTTGRRSRTNHLVASQSAATADAEFERGAASGTEIGFDRRLAAVFRVLAADASFGARYDFESVVGNRFATDFANYCGLPIVVFEARGILVNQEIRLSAIVANQPVAVRLKQLTDQLFRRVRSTTE
jgi:hypothetical protein